MIKKIKWIVAVVVVLVVGVIVAKYLISGNSDEKKVEYVHNNIYEDGVTGLLEDIKTECELPNVLYLNTECSIHFKEDGTVTKVSVYLYGEDQDGDQNGFLIDYDQTKSEDISIHMQTNISLSYDDQKKLQPLIDTIATIPIQKTISNWSSASEYGILYKGQRSFGYNTEGIWYVNAQGETKQAEMVYSELLGYFVSVYVPDKQDEITPYRYILVDDLDNVEFEDPNAVQTAAPEEEAENIGKEYYIDENLGYRLVIVDAAAGSRFYSLYKTTDGGDDWEEYNSDPFAGEPGGGVDMVFFDEKLGFLLLINPSGDSGELYRTDDGGSSFTKIEIPVKDATQTPLTIPYAENGTLSIEIAKASDSSIYELYQSTDQGVTWNYVKDITK